MNSKVVIVSQFQKLKHVLIKVAPMKLLKLEIFKIECQGVDKLSVLRKISPEPSCFILRFDKGIYSLIVHERTQIGVRKLRSSNPLVVLELTH